MTGVLVVMMLRGRGGMGEGMGVMGLLVMTDGM